MVILIVNFSSNGAEQDFSQRYLESAGVLGFARIRCCIDNLLSIQLVSKETNAGKTNIRRERRGDGAYVSDSHFFNVII